MASVRLDTKNVGDIIKIKENGVPADYIIAFKITPDKPFNGFTSGTVVCRTKPVPIFNRTPLLILEDDKLQVDDDGILSAITDEGRYK